jgi:heat shock protein HslJ
VRIVETTFDSSKLTKVWQTAKTKMNAAEVYQAVVFAAFTAFFFKETLGGGESMCNDCSGVVNFR